MFGPGIGKPRSSLGKFVDRRMSQEELMKITGIQRTQISRLCDGKTNTRPNLKTQIKIIGALRSRGYDVTIEDFWPI